MRDLSYANIWKYSYSVAFSHNEHKGFLHTWGIKDHILIPAEYLCETLNIWLCGCVGNFQEMWRCVFEVGSWPITLCSTVKGFYLFSVMMHTNSFIFWHWLTDLKMHFRIMISDRYLLTPFSFRYSLDAIHKYISGWKQSIATNAFFSLLNTPQAVLSYMALKETSCDGAKVKRRMQVRRGK